MKGIVCICLIAVVATALARPNEKYTTKYDNVNIQEILDNDRLLNAYVDCLLDKVKCTSEGKELKSHMQEALETHCEKCTDHQKEETEHVIGHLINNKPDIWELLCNKYDPDRKFSTKYEDDLKKAKKTPK